MKKNNKFISLCLCVICVASLPGCGKGKSTSLNATDPMQQVATMSAETTQPTIHTEQDTAITFDYAPGSMGIYVKADPNIEADPEVLNSKIGRAHV